MPNYKDVSGPTTLKSNMVTFLFQGLKYYQYS